MSCYLLAGNRERGDHFASEGDLTRLETSYRRYAKLFERVVLVLKSDQARDWYLNYPHVVDEGDRMHPAVGVATALKNARSEAIFVGSADLVDFPLDLVANLVRRYRGEPFLGYKIQSGETGKRQPWFGIYSRQLAEETEKSGESLESTLLKVLESQGRFIELPDSAPAESIGLK
jgi:molybdopterin-guanine dinucleotide biosynthesis protein A